MVGSPGAPTGRERIVIPDSSVREPRGVQSHGVARPRHLRQRPARHGAAGPVGALHRSGLRPRGTERALRDPARHAGAGQEPRDAAHGSDPSAARRGPQDGLAEAPRQRLRGVGGPGLGRPVTGRCHGRRGPRHGRALPLPRAVRPRARFDRADRLGRAGARVRHGDRPGLQRLVEGLLRPRAGPHVRGGHGGGARRPGRRGRGPPLRGGARLQVDLPPAGGGQPPALVPPGLRPAVGRDRASGRAAVVPRRRADVPDARLRAGGPRPA